MPCEEKTTPIVAFMARLRILYRTHVGRNHGELHGIKQHVILT